MACAFAVHWLELSDKGELINHREVGLVICTVCIFSRDWDSKDSELQRSLNAKPTFSCIAPRQQYSAPSSIATTSPADSLLKQGRATFSWHTKCLSRGASTHFTSMRNWRLSRQPSRSAIDLFKVLWTLDRGYFISAFTRSHIGYTGVDECSLSDYRSENIEFLPPELYAREDFILIWRCSVVFVP